MIGQEISRITQVDLQSLIDNVVLEGKAIEYKAILPGTPMETRRNFLPMYLPLQMLVGAISSME